MNKDFYKIEDCDYFTSTSKSILEVILDKLNSFKRENLNSPVFVILDKRSYKQLNKEVSRTYKEYYLTQVFNMEIKVVKSKEQIICVGI
jgi:uncharacterized linocin/CFP29 family protein